MMMDYLLNKISSDLADSILSESIISKDVIKTKLKTALNLMVQKTEGFKGYEQERYKQKLMQRKKQAQRDSIEKNFWRDIAKIYIGENKMQPYYDRLNKEIEKVK